MKKHVKTPVLLFGGGAGHIGDHLAEELSEVSFDRADLKISAFNTDEEDLYALHDHIKKIAIGPLETGGWGAGADPEVGLAAAVESDAEITAPLEDADIAIFLACLGGGTGTGSLPYAVGKYKKMMDAQKDEKLHKKKAGIVIVTQPFATQDSVVTQNARDAYEKLHDIGLPIIMIPNDRFLPDDSDKSIPLPEMFAAGNRQLAHFMGRMIRSLGARHDFMNIDRNDIVSHLLLKDDQSTLAYYGVGYAKEGESTRQALEMAAKNPFLETKLSSCKKAIISVDCLNGTADDWLVTQEFMQTNRHHLDAEWRCGVNTNYQPLPFEEKAGYKVAVFIIGIGCANEAVSVTDGMENYPGSVGIGSSSIPQNQIPRRIGKNAAQGRHLKAEEAENKLKVYEESVQDKAKSPFPATS